MHGKFGTMFLDESGVDLLEYGANFTYISLHLSVNGEPHTTTDSILVFCIDELYA
jgi:hypothetical protein